MVGRWGALVALTAGLMVMTSPAAVAAPATDPVNLGGAYILDTNGSVTGDENRIIESLDALYEKANIQLLVVYVDSFTSPSGAVEWADATAIENNLGTNDVLLAVATVDRQYALSIDPEFPLSDDQLDRVETDIESELRNSNWADAAIAGADSIAAEATGVVGPNQPGASAGGGISPVVPIVGGVAVVGVGVFVFSRIRKRKRDGSVTAVPEQMTQKELDRRAGSLLVQLDDSLKTSEQELGFAVAQFGDDATADFTAVLASAKAKVAEAFGLKQKLDDHEPDSEADKRAWTTRIIELCEAADAELDSQADAFDALRELEKNAPQELAAVGTALSSAAERKAAASAILSTLQATYAEAALAPVSANIAQADKLLEFATASSTKASAAIAAGASSEAAVAVRAAQSSVGQAEELFTAIDTLAADLAQASSSLDAAVADTLQDIAAAQALAATAPADASLASAIAAAQQSLDGSVPGSPIDSLERVERANRTLDTVFDAARDLQDKLARATAQLPTTISTAQSQLTSAMNFITTRRGGIGEAARTRVSEAERQLAQASALATSDPIAALAAARQATTLASAAFELARRDVDSYTAESNYSSASYGSGGADLGGILGELLFGSGDDRDDSGWGWGGGSSGNSSSYRSSRSSSRSSSFGGSSRSSSRSSSRGSSRSSGGRSRGGRF